MEDKAENLRAKLIYLVEKGEFKENLKRLRNKKKTPEKVLKLREDTIRDKMRD